MIKFLKITEMNENNKILNVISRNGEKFKLFRSMCSKLKDAEMTNLFWETIVVGDCIHI